MPLVPLPAGHDPEVEALARFFNTTLGFVPNRVLTMMRRPAKRASLECAVAAASVLGAGKHGMPEGGGR